MNRSHFLFIATLLLLSSISSAQKFGDGNPVWNYGLSESPNDLKLHYKVSVKEERVFKGKRCFILEENYFGEPRGCNYLPYDNMVCTDSQRVFFWSPTLEEFQTLYDFGAKKGDSWQFRSDEQNGFLNGQFTVDSTFSMHVNGKLLKAQYVLLDTDFPIRGSNYKYLIVEQLGCAELLFPWEFAEGSCLVRNFNGLRCFEDDSLGFYQFESSVDCDYTQVGNEELSSNRTDWSVFPNPGSGVFKIDGLKPTDNYSYMLFNKVGQVIHRQSIAGNTLHLGQMTKGVYFISVFENENLIISQKLIIHD